MGKINHKIPKFKNDAEAADFWDTHDSTKYLSQTKPAHLSFPKPRHKVVIDLGEKQWSRLIRLASIRQIPYVSLLEKLVSEKLSAH